MKRVNHAKRLLAGLCAAMMMVLAAAPAFAAQPWEQPVTAAQLEQSNASEDEQVQALTAALKKLNVTYDSVENDWTIESSILTVADKNKTCCLSPWIFVPEGAEMVFFNETFSYIGSKEIDLEKVIIRAGDTRYTYTCDDPDMTSYGYDKSLGRWWAMSSFMMEDDEVGWLCEMLSANSIIMRFQGENYAQYDYTWTAQDRQYITDVVNAFTLLQAASPAVRIRALSAVSA